MSEIRNDRKYSKEHEWVLIQGDLAIVGISDYAQNSLGDIVFLETKPVGEKLESKQGFGTVESVKAAEDLYAPLSGEIAEINQGLISKPEEINSKPYDSWIIKIKNFSQSDLDSLMDSTAYQEFIQTLEG
ncbi:MAG: glycine cleavage system protein GcvH [Leptonema sp. (in: Bacteria)]|nr:glycine cleavage system protein GcvH [Leptonema sp. (in: bacteria)]